MTRRTDAESLTPADLERAGAVKAVAKVLAKGTCYSWQAFADEATAAIAVYEQHVKESKKSK